MSSLVLFLATKLRHHHFIHEC